MSLSAPSKSKGIFLNHAAISPISQEVAAASILALQELSTGAPDIDGWVLSMEKSRRKVASLINCSPTSIGFMQNTSQAISTVAQGLSFEPGDEVLIPSYEYPANQYPWLNLESQGVKIHRVDPIDGKITPEWLENNISPNTKLFAFSYIQYSNGFKADVKELTALCRKKGILTLVDAIQGFGAFPVDVEEWDVDFCAFGSQKWLLAPPGISVLYIKESFINAIIPPLAGAFSVENPFDMENIELHFAPAVKRIESGTMNFTLFPAFLKALENFEMRGVERISNLIVEKVAFLTEEIQKRGYTVTSPLNREEMSGIVTFTGDKGAMNNLYQELCKFGVCATFRANTIRFSPHFYNSLDTLKEVVKLL